MEHYVVSARKYRPSTFNTVIGQKPLTAALKHAVATDRLAHAYLFCGSRGVGKTSCARIFAKTINCQHRTADGEACNECDSCKDFNNGTSLNIIELDAASHNGVDDIKNLIEQVLVPPTEGRYRVFIIDEVHMLSAAAFNAFLKTLEEPPAHAIFILATTEKHKIIPTILSRCQIYDFNRITIQDMVAHLSEVAAKEGINAEPAALNIISQKADGAMRDALSIFDQVAASTLGNITYQNTIDNLNILDSAYYSRLVDAFLRNDVPSALLIYKEIRERGFDSQFFINGLGLYMRDLMVAYQPATLCLLETSDEVKKQLAEIAAKCSPKFIYAAMSLCNDADLNFRAATNKQFLVELTLVKLCQITAPTEPIVPKQNIKPITPQAPQQPTNAPQQDTHAPQQVYQPQQAYHPQQQAYQQYQPQQQAYTAQQAPAVQQTQGGYAPTPQPKQTVQAPPTAAAYRPQQAVSKKSGLPSFSINGNKNTEDEKEKAESDDQTHRRNTTYTSDQLKKAWLKYIEKHPTERILINTMKTALPVAKSEHLYAIEVDDNIQINTINDAKAEILNFLHDALNNDYIDLEATLRQGEASPITWTQREVLQHMAEKHPVLKDFINDFSLSI